MSPLPESMDSVPATTPTRPPLLRESRTVSRADPSAFLGLFSGTSRGFWGMGDRWVAWVGVARELRIQGGPGQGGRFQELREGARELRVEGPTPRFFGGLSFLAEGPRDPAWAGYPSARFVLPRLTLEHDDGGLVLSAWTGDGDEGEDEAGLEEIVGALEGTDVPGDHPSRPRESLPAVESPSGGPGARHLWDEAVIRILEAIGHRKVEKAVLARTRDAAFPTPVDPCRLLRALRRENPGAHVFLLEPEPGRIFFGAAPELLAGVRDRDFEATAVAGSIGRGGDPGEDRALAARLLASEKDRREHDVTVREILDSLDGRMEALDVDARPRVLTLARIQHLETRIRGRARPGEDVLSLVEALHPTPAVCGRPRPAALDLIRTAEPFDRGWYAGPVGWFDPLGNGEFVPALRSAVGGGDSWRLFAGAGIVPGSHPEAEWAETELKFEPALRALRVGAGGAG